MLRMIDTPGQEEYSALLPQFVEQAEAFLVGYDITSTLSFSAMSNYNYLIKKLVIINPSN